MPTKLPRITVAVTEEQHDILTRMAKVQRRPASSFIRELVDAAMPALRASLPILEAREKTLAEQPKALQEAAAGFLDMLNGIDPNQLSLLGVTSDDMEMLARKAATEETPGDARKPGEEGTDAPPDRSEARTDGAPAPSPRKSRSSRSARQ
jgi:uncharacterized protein (DUF1778 family)